MNCKKLKEKLRKEIQKVDNKEKENVEFNINDALDLYVLLANACAFIEANEEN